MRLREQLSVDHEMKVMIEIPPPRCSCPKLSADPMVGFMKVLGYICLSLVTLFLIYAAWMCWFFRDGLGPDSVESIGRLAWSRFWGEFRFTLLFSAPVLCFGAWCIRRKRKDSYPET